MKKTFVFRTFFVIALLMAPATAMGYRHFYRAGPYQSETRYDRNCLTSVDVSIMGGSTKKGYNGDKNKVDYLQTYGTTDLFFAFEGYDVSSILPADMTDAQKGLINDFLDLAGADADEKIGKIDFTGKFKYLAFDINLTQNFCNGFFAQLNIPVHRLEVSNVGYTHQSSTAETEWTDFEDELNTFLGFYNLSKGNVKETGIGDIAVYGGWTYNNDSSDFLDFFDVTIKAGFSIPTARQRDVTEAFSIPSGYNGHVGIPVSFDMSLGIFNWCTWGAHVGGQFFLKHDGVFRMRLSNEETGWIKLAQGGARQDLGNLWDIGTYLKADHIAGGFSLMVGYNYTAQEDSSLTPTNTEMFDATIVNGDEMLKKWRMHTVSVMAEYDFAEEGKSWNPKIGAFYNVPVAGKRIFKTWTAGGSAGLNITWKF